MSSFVSPFTRVSFPFSILYIVYMYPFIVALGFSISPSCFPFRSFASSCISTADLYQLLFPAVPFISGASSIGSMLSYCMSWWLSSEL